MTPQQERLSEAMELWRQSHCLLPRTDIYKILDIEGRRLRLNHLYERFLLTGWVDSEPSKSEIDEFVAGVDNWRQIVVTEILTNGTVI